MGLPNSSLEPPICLWRSFGLPPAPRQFWVPFGASGFRPKGTELGFWEGFRGFRGERLCWWGLDTFALGSAMLQELQKLLALKDELGPGHPEFWMGGGCFSVDSDGPSAENSQGLSPVAFILFQPSFFLTNHNFWGNWSRKQGHVGPKMAPGLLLVPSEKGSPGSKDTF